MAVIETFDYASNEPRKPATTTPSLTRILMGFVRRQQEHRTMARLSRLDPRLIRDAGIEPGDVYRALEGTWDEVDGEKYRSE